MPVYSVAQTLPMHVIEDIVQYVSLEHIAALPLKELPLRPKKQPKFLPLMSVCQSWRAVAGSMFYHTALLKLKDVEPHEFSSERYLTLEHVIKIGALLLVKELYVHVYVPNFCVNWDSMDTSDESTAQTLATMVSDCGDLPSVRSLKLVLTSDDGKYRRRLNTVDKPEHDKDIILKNIQTFGEHLKQHAPNAWKVEVFSNYFESRVNLDHQEDFVVDNISQLVGANVGHLSLKHVKITKLMAVKLSENTLRSLTIAYHKGTQKHIDIVRNNASTLETLCVDHITTHSMLKMTWGKTGGYHTLVYPRLKHLIINSCVGQRYLSYRQPLANPFPKLQTLICRGYFPFSSPIVLMEGRAHIRHLDITLDTALLQMYADSKVFEKGSFQNLQFVSLGWAERNIFSKRRISEQLYTITSELCAKTQVMRINNVRANLVDSKFSSIHFASNLRVLDMPYNMLDINELIPMLCSFPKLQKANVAFMDISEAASSCMPTVGMIEEYQKRYKSSFTSAWALGIHSVSFGTSRRAAELLVLLVDILTSIKRVSIDYNCPRSPYKVIHAISYVKRRKVYKNHQVQDVEFVADECW
ncbi:hypothetical protein IW147_002328 [Coemansia sp. RSA 720]|nr:hypothetical protein IW147_002328 [Coemansia sp. RSA 720]